MDYSYFRVLQDGLVVAEVQAPSYSQGAREIAHYAMMYGQDGPVDVQERKNGRWRSMKSGRLS